MLFLACYLKKPQVANKRLSIDDNNEFPIITISSQTHPDKIREFYPLKFLAELSCHVPNSRERTLRYYGAYAPRTRGANKKLFKTLIRTSKSQLDIQSENKKQGASSWARLIAKVYLVDPLVCPECKEEMN